MDAAPVARAPWEMVRDWFHEAGNYVHTLDVAAEDLHAALGLNGANNGARLAQALSERHGCRSRLSETDATTLRDYDADSHVLTVSAALPVPSRAFQLANQLMQFELGAENAPDRRRRAARRSGRRGAAVAGPGQLRRRRAGHALWRLPGQRARAAPRYRPAFAPLRRQLRAGLPPPLDTPARRTARNPVLLLPHRHGRQHHQAALGDAAPVRSLRAAAARSGPRTRPSPSPTGSSSSSPKCQTACAMCPWPRGS